MREYGDLVDVKLRGDQPLAFRWRQRSYQVSDVLDQWRERTSWWLERTESVALEQRVWRLEARPSGAGSTGVFELTRGTTGWSLQRLAD